MPINAPLIRYHGGKFRLAPWVISFFPENHTVYIELFGGAGSILFQKPRSWQEIYNDMDADMFNLFKVLRDDDQCAVLKSKLELTLYSRDEFMLAYEPTEDPIERARRVIVRAQMGFGSAGATKANTGFRTDSRRLYGTSSRLWAKFPGQVDMFNKRLKRVMIENRPALRLIEMHDGPDALFYADPPYVHSTRFMKSGRQYYNHEMTDSDHEDLLNALIKAQGFVVLSGYDTDLYNDMLVGWTKFQKTARISAGRGTEIRLENIWINPYCADAQVQQSLFDSAVK